MAVELTTNLLAEIGGWPALKEARTLLERGKVHDAQRDGDTIRARVQGAEKIHDARIVLADRVANVEAHCTCSESRRSGRVCAHALAAGLAILQPAKAAPIATPQKISAPTTKRHLIGDAPDGMPAIEATFLLPLQLAEALRQSSVRVILEARRDNESAAQPWEPATRDLKNSFAVDEDDARALTALEAATGATSGINAIPRDRLPAFLRALAGHPRVWLGKKQRIDVRAADETPKIAVHRRADGTLELTPQLAASTPAGTELSLSGWFFDGVALAKKTSLPPGFSTGPRLITPAKIPEFLAREWPQLEPHLILPPGFEEFVLETGKPIFEATLEGALSGITLDFAARYGERTFPLDAKITPTGDYFPDPAQPGRYWHRHLAAEKIALAEAEAPGFKPVRSDAATLSLTREDHVARFLANTLPRWRATWTVRFGPRLEAAMEQIDIAEPEFSLRSRSGEDWLGLDLKLTVRGEPIPLAPAEIQRWLQTGQSHARTAKNRVLLVPTAAWSEMREVLADCAVDQEPDGMRVSAMSAPFLSDALTAQGFHVRENAAANFAPPHVQLDAKLAAILRPYQLHGVEWLAGLAQRKFHGLLADDMGLGKTLQALAFASWLRATQKSTSPLLVVCPTSLITNWQREAARFVPHLRVLDLTGADRAEKFPQIAQHDLLVTSYAILRRDVERYRAHDFSLVILDEAQHIKNRASQNAQAAKALRAQHRLILTGTPLENSILDLWSLFDFLLPGYLGTVAEFRERYETPLTRGPEPRTMQRLRQRVRPFFLRRTKEEVLPDLPPKLEHLTLCDLSAEQSEVYRAVLAQGRREVFENSGKAGGGRDRIAVLTTLLRLRQVCCHLGMLPQGDEKRAWKEPSAKLDRTFELIDEAIDGGHRVLLFSQFVRALHLLRKEAKRREIPFCYLDGQTTNRQAEIDHFQNDASIPLFFISLKAGGTGLNLTGADTVIHFDPWWNPAVEEQAASRAHRLGQSRRVQAYKLIAAGTVEEKIQAMQARKRELFQASLGDDAFVESLSGDELEELLAE